VTIARRPRKAQRERRLRPNLKVSAAQRALDQMFRRAIEHDARTCETSR